MKQKQSITLKKYPKFTTLIASLVKADYTRVPMVMDPGEFSVRGDIIDLFSYQHSHPIRLEYFGEKLDRLVSFNCVDQRTLSKITSTSIHFVKDSEILFRPPKSGQALMGVISDIDEGTFVVHEDYGIGIYKGLVRLVRYGCEGEFLHIQYKGKDKLYVPLEQLGRIHKYSGGDSTPTISGLHDGSWTRAKHSVKKATEALAKDVFLLFKLRHNTRGHSFSEDTVWQLELEQSFGHAETPDQRLATSAIKKDMESGKPMDRLVCGDVGYGKTEVFLRAAFKAVEDGCQVAVIVPTTLLAEQHYKTFLKRFKDFDYQVGLLSRFESRKKQLQTISKLKQHTIHLVIGTHRLLQKDIVFSKLGLLIIDEEQRFGVAHKEKLKQLKPNVDVLSVSATPIPRTLYMALSGAKELSMLKTAPKKRKPILTAVSVYREDRIKEVVEREIKRKGQVYYLYNRVKTIHKKKVVLQSLFPKLTIDVAHGQLSEKELKTVMTAFINKEIDILLCTTIIESGLDIPNANSLIVDDSDHFGLSQIHQLKGRVGRSERQGYALFLYPDKPLTSMAEKRLQAIKEYSALGAGYDLAKRDLEIRGAGQLLGHKQHGFMTTVGFELYCKLLEESVHKVKGTHQKKQTLAFLSTGLTVLIPEDYVKEPRIRLALYQALTSLENKSELKVFEEGLKDRFGPIPEQVLDLLHVIKRQLP